VVDRLILILARPKYPGAACSAQVR